MLRRFPPRFYAPDSGQPQGGTAPPAPESQSTPDVAASLQRLIERQSGDAGRVAELLYRENYELRERNRALAAQAPAQGAVVLDATQAAHWQAYTALGEPTALQQALEARQQAESRLASLEREATLRQVAEASGFRPNVLSRLAEGLTLELREQTQDGQTQRVPYVVAGDQATPLTDYAQREWADFLPALTTQQAAPTGQGPSFVRQQAGPGAPADPVSSFIESANQRREARPNPLRRS